MDNLVFYPYSKDFPKKFEKIKNKIMKVLGNNIDIHHIGSTAVPGLEGKGIIDILIGVNNWREGRSIVNKLQKIGFTHIHERERGRIFLSNKKVSKYGDIHIHIVRKRTKQYRKFLEFRDYLIKNKKAREEYIKEKKRILKQVGNDRVAYKMLKSIYIKSVLKKIDSRKNQ